MTIFNIIAEDVQAVIERDPAAQSPFIIWLTYPGLHARWSHEVEHWLWGHNARSLARVSSQFTRFMTGVEIHPGAQIGRRFFIDHAMGVIIGETTVIGDDCTLYQGVTLGGTGKETGKRHPTLGNNVMVGVGAAVLGNVTISDNVKIGGGAVVVDDVPSNCTVVGIPGHIVVRDGQRVFEDARKAQHKETLPDPLAEEHELMRAEIDELREMVEQLAASSRGAQGAGAQDAGDGNPSEGVAGAPGVDAAVSAEVRELREMVEQLRRELDELSLQR